MRFRTALVLVAVSLVACSDDGSRGLVEDPNLELPAGFVLTDSLDNASDNSLATDLADPEAGPQPWGEPTWRQPRLFPDGQRLLVFPHHTGPLIIDSSGSAVTQVSEGRLNCPMITRSGNEIIYIPRDDEPGARLLHRINLTTKTETGDFAVSVGETQFPPNTECPIEIGERVATTQGHGVIVLSDFGGQDPEVVYEDEACVALTYPVSPDPEILPFLARCDDRPSGSGLFEYDARTGETQHLIQGLIGAPMYSFDGEWIVFTYVPSGDAENGPFEYWIATADGNSARKLGEGRFSPVLVPG